MRLGSLLLLTALTAPCSALAEQLPMTPSPITPVADAQAANTNTPTTPELQLQQQIAEQQTQLISAREENQRLREELQEALAENAPPPLISEQQIWYLIGAGSLLLGIVVGALLRGSRRSRREWLN